MPAPESTPCPAHSILWGGVTGDGVKKKELTVSLIVKTYFQVFSASYILGYGVLKIFKGFIVHPDI